MRDPEIVEDRRLIAARADGLDVCGVFEPERVARASESADLVVDRARRDRTPAAYGPELQTDAVLLLVAVRGRRRAIHDPRGNVVRVVYEVGREKANRGETLERVEQRAIPLLGRIDDVVVELDQVIGGRLRERRAIRALADVPAVADDPSARIPEPMDEARL